MILEFVGAGPSAVKSEDLNPNKILWGPLFPERVQILIAIPIGVAVKLVSSWPCG